MTNILTGEDALKALESSPSLDGSTVEREFLAQLDAYYASPKSSFYDARIERRFLEQKLKHLGFKPYPKDGLITFGASGTDMCDRQIVFKNSKVKPEKSEDEPHRGRQRRIGNAVVDFFQLDMAHMPKVLGDKALFRFVETKSGEYAMEDAAQVRKVFEVVNEDTGEIVKFAITAKPDGILQYGDERLIFEYKTKAGGVVEMNGLLDWKGAQESHLRQVTAESLVFGINRGLLVYESTAKPSWFSDEEKKNVPKTRKTWRDGKPIPDIRPFYFEISERQQHELLQDLAKQAALVYAEEVPEIHVDMTSKCGFCPFKDHCKSILTDKEKTYLQEVENQMRGNERMNGRVAHRNLVEYLKGVE